MTLCKVTGVNRWINVDQVVKIEYRERVLHLKLIDGTTEKIEGSQEVVTFAEKVGIKIDYMGQGR
jgi:hypothetical protein